jgi:hypothetical protein
MISYRIMGGGIIVVFSASGLPSGTLWFNQSATENQTFVVNNLRALSCGSAFVSLSATQRYSDLIGIAFQQL